MCLRFLVIPYLRYLHGQDDEVAEQVRLKITPPSSKGGTPLSPAPSQSHLNDINNEHNPPTATATTPKLKMKKPPHLHAFWHGHIEHPTSGSRPEFRIHADQGSSKIRPLLDATAWFVATEGGNGEVQDGDVGAWVPLGVGLGSLGS